MNENNLIVNVQGVWKECIPYMKYRCPSCGITRMSGARAVATGLSCSCKHVIKFSDQLKEKMKNACIESEEQRTVRITGCKEKLAVLDTKIQATNSTAWIERNIFKIVPIALICVPFILFGRGVTSHAPTKEQKLFQNEKQDEINKLEAQVRNDEIREKNTPAKAIQSNQPKHKEVNQLASTAQQRLGGDWKEKAKVLFQKLPADEQAAMIGLHMRVVRDQGLSIEEADQYVYEGMLSRAKSKAWFAERKKEKARGQTGKATDREIKDYADKKFKELDAIPEYRRAVATDNFDLQDKFEESKNKEIALHFGITPAQVTQARVRAVWK